MIRITNSLFEAIQEVTQGEKEPAAKVETKEVAEGQVDKAHYCATHVEHSIFGEGECIAEAHADPDADGNIEWYTVQFSDGIRKVYTEALKVKKAKMHEHAEVSNDVVAETEQTNEAIYVPPVSHVSPKKPSSSSKDEDNRKASMLIDKIRSFRQLKQDYKEKGNLERHREFHTKLHDADKEYQKLGHKSLLRKDDHVMEESAMSDLDADRKERAYKTRQANTTMKHISNPTPGEKAAAKDIKPGIAGYRDRIAMLKSAQARGGLKAEGMDPVGKEDDDIDNDGDKDKSDSYLHNRRKAIKAAMKEEVTVVLENLLTIEIPSNAKYSDYLDAVKTIIKTDDPEFQQDIVKIAAEAFDTGDIDVIVEAELIRQGIVEAYRSTAEYGNNKLYSKELGMDIDRTKPGVTRVTKRIAHTTGESPEEAKARRSADKREKQMAKMAKVLRAKK